MKESIKLGVSACLLGQKVRYDGQHKHDAFITETLGKYIEFVPVCPEVECGLPIPREAMRLMGNPESPRLMTRNTGRDITEQMQNWIAVRLQQLEAENLCGYIFKSRSPSSGMERVKVYNDHGGISGMSPGLFAKAFMARFPLLPVEEEGRLNDPELRENFIERIFTLDRYRRSVLGRRKMADLVQFHAGHKYLLLSHSETHTRTLGRLVSHGAKKDSGIFDAYEKGLLTALALKTTPAKHVNVLQHMLGFFKDFLAPDEKKELLDLIAAYKQLQIPLIVPVTLISHYVRKYQVHYLQDQYYLHPHPLELKLRNHA